MTEAQAIEELKRHQEMTDFEAAHVLADNILCIMLERDGYEELVAEWRKVKRYYA